MKAAGARAERWRGFRELRHGTIIPTAAFIDPLPVSRALSGR